jgi:hypothetical protein
MAGLSSNRQNGFSDRRLRQIGVLYLLIGLLHGLLDPGISYFAIEILGIGREANPLMRFPMQKGILPFVLAHIPLYTGLLMGYFSTIHLLKKEKNKEGNTVYQLAVIGLTLLIGWGIWINLRNVIVLLSMSG